MIDNPEPDKVMAEKFKLISNKLGFKTDGIDVKSKGMVDGQFHAIMTRPEYRDTRIDFLKESFNYPVWLNKMKEFRETYTSGFCTTK